MPAYGYMGGTYTVTIGYRGTVVIPAELRMSAGIREGGTLVFVQTDGGIVLLTREQLKERVPHDVADTDLVTQLFAERRANAVAEDAA